MGHLLVSTHLRPPMGSARHWGRGRGGTCPQTEHMRGGPSHTQLVKGRCISGWTPAPGDTLPLPAPPQGAASAQGKGVTVSEADVAHMAGWAWR